MAPSEPKKKTRKAKQQLPTNVAADNKKPPKNRNKPHTEAMADTAVPKKKNKNKGEDAAKKASKKRKIEQVVDERFTSVHYDPKFQRMPKNRSRVVIGSRFQEVLSDKRFAPSSAPVDKRGKARKGKEQPFLHYYMREGEEARKEEFDEDDQMDGRLEDSVYEGEDGTESESSSSDSSDTSEEEEDIDYEVQVDGDVVPFLLANHDDTPRTEKPTHRLAVVDMDWDHVKADDIYIIMSSCLPKDGHISSVSVYPSEFGLKCMEVEEKSGPYALIYGDKGLEDEDADDEDYIDTEGEKEKLRTYELNKLKYYYAVVDCDSTATADHLYNNLDGVEISKTSNVMDLRFIPDSLEFHPLPRDTTTEAPTSYRRLDFFTRALQHSNPETTWDGDEPERKKLRLSSNAAKLKEEDYQCFLASDEDESDEETAELLDGETRRLKKKEIYQSLLLKGDGSDAEDDHDKDMEITFNTGLEDLVNRIREKKDKGGDTVWEAHLKRKKEAKRAKTKNGKYYSKDDESDSDYQVAPNDPDQPDDFFEEEMLDSDTKTKTDSSRSKKKGKKDKKQLEDLDKEMEASAAELELLCANNIRDKSSSEDDSIRTKKGKKKKLISEDKLPKEDYHNDERFSALFNSHDFALDPTDPQFKRSAAYTRQILQKQKQAALTKGKELSDQSHVPPESSAPENSDFPPNNVSSKNENLELLSLVRSVKRKAGSLKTDKKGT